MKTIVQEFQDLLRSSVPLFLLVISMGLLILGIVLITNPTSITSRIKKACTPREGGGIFLARCLGLGVIFFSVMLFTAGISELFFSK